MKYSTVIDIQGCDLLVLENGEKVFLAGIYIPNNGINFRESLCVNLKKLILNKSIKYRLILKQHSDLYPSHDLVHVYLSDGAFLNELLLKEGMAYYDHGSFERSNYFSKLEGIAKKQKKGIWGSDNPPIPIYCGKKDWRLIHFVDCPEVEDLKDGEREVYYWFPEYPFHGKRFAGKACDFCEAKYQQINEKEDRAH